MYNTNIDTGGDVSDDNEFDLHELIDLSDSSDDEVSFLRLPLPSPPPSPLPTQDEPVMRAAPLPEDETEPKANLDSQAEVQPQKDDAEVIDSEKDEGDEVVVDDASGSVGQGRDQISEKVTQDGAGDRQMARCSGTRGRARGRGRGRGRGAANGSRAASNAATTSEGIDRATTPPIADSFTPNPASTPSPRGRGRPRRSTTSRTPPSSSTTPSPASNAIFTPPTSPVSGSERSPVAAARSDDDDCDAVGAKTPPLTPTPSPSSRKRKATLSSLLSGSTANDASIRQAQEGASPSTSGKKRRVDDVPDKEAEEGSSNVVVLLPSPTKRRTRAAKAKVSFKIDARMWV